MSKMGNLYIVSTPIGNLEDITFRAVEVLGEVDVVFAEDTRITGRLFEKYDVKTPLKSLNARTERVKAKDVLKYIEEGRDVAYVSDAGTPGISDPGSFLVSFVRENLPAANIIPIPGASALSAALSVAGVDVSSFTFLGFLPHKKGRQTIFEDIGRARKAIVLYESPHRILKTLTSLSEVLEEGREIIICRELTKIHEEVVSGDAKELLGHLEADPEKMRGEFVLIISRKP